MRRGELLGEGGGLGLRATAKAVHDLLEGGRRPGHGERER
jgi:hypothetical protein